MGAGLIVPLTPGGRPHPFASARTPSKSTGLVASSHDSALACWRKRGFEDLELDDSTEEYCRDARTEYEMMKGPLHSRMIELLGTEGTDHFIEDWRSMTVVLVRGELRPGRYRARKPT